MTTYKIKRTENGITFKRDRRLEYRIVRYRGGYSAECCFTRTGCMSFAYDENEFPKMIENTLNYLESIVYSGPVEFIGMENIKPF